MKEIELKKNDTSEYHAVVAVKILEDGILKLVQGEGLRVEDKEGNHITFLNAGQTIEVEAQYKAELIRGIASLE